MVCDKTNMLHEQVLQTQQDGKTAETKLKPKHVDVHAAHLHTASCTGNHTSIHSPLQ
jgi:hypothetical protein